MKIRMVCPIVLLTYQMGLKVLHEAWKTSEAACFVPGVRISIRHNDPVGLWLDHGHHSSGIDRHRSEVRKPVYASDTERVHRVRMLGRGFVCSWK